MRHLGRALVRCLHRAQRRVNRIRENKKIRTDACGKRPASRAEKTNTRRVSKITCGFSKINCGMESWANGNSPKSVVGRNRWILNKKMVKKSGNRVTFGCLIWYKTYFLYYLNFGPFTACFLYGPLVLSVRKQTSFHGLGTAKMAAFFRCEKRKRFRICSKFP